MTESPSLSQQLHELATRVQHVENIARVESSNGLHSMRELSATEKAKVKAEEHAAQLEARGRDLEGQLERAREGVQAANVANAEAQESARLARTNAGELATQARELRMECNQLRAFVANLETELVGDEDSAGWTRAALDRRYERISNAVDTVRQARDAALTRVGELDGALRRAAGEGAEKVSNGPDVLAEQLTKAFRDFGLESTITRLFSGK